MTALHQREGLGNLNNIYLRLFHASELLAAEKTNVIDPTVPFIINDFQFMLNLLNATEVLDV